MHWSRRLVVVILLSGAVAGCSGEIAKPISLDVALRGVEEDLKAASGVSLHDIVSGDGAQEADFTKAILQAQCFYRRPNPFVPVMSKDQYRESPAANGCASGPLHVDLFPA